MKVIAQSNIQHDGQLYTKGQEFEVTEKQAADLLAAQVIQPIQGVTPTPPQEADGEGLNSPEEKRNVEKGINEVANLPIKAVGMKKTILIGIARANGLEVEKTATPSEVYNMIKEYREKNNIVLSNTKEMVEDAPQEADGEAKDETPEESTK